MFMEKQQHLFFQGAPMLANQLAAAVRTGGSLTVSRERSASQVAISAFSASRSTSSRYKEEQVASMRGFTFLKRARPLGSKRADGILLGFDMIPAGDGLAPLYQLIDGGDQAITVAAMTVTKHAAAITLAEDYADASTFISEENLDQLELWGRHPDNTSPFSIERNDHVLIFRAANSERARVAARWPAVASQGEWRELADRSAPLLRRPGG